MRRKRTKRLLRLLPLVAVLVLAMGIICGAYAADNVTIKVTGLYGQSDARSMLQMINDLRTGKKVDGGETKPWALDEDGNVNYANYTNLKELQYDYALERTAMQRAIEIALHFDHGRLDGTNWSTAFPSGYGYSAENIAAGRNTAQTTFEQWCEANEPYSGQGHRRNMLSRNYNRIGIAKVEFAGRSFWVQNFGSKSTSEGLTQSPPVDTNRQMTIQVDPSLITSSSITAVQQTASIEYGATDDVPNATVKMMTAETWPQGMKAIDEGYTVTSDNTSILSVNGTSMNGLKIGTANLQYTSILDPAKTASVTVDVTPISLSSGQITVDDSDLVYSGSSIKPTPQVRLNGNSLIEDTDYTVSYENNINAGNQAKVIVTGKDNYKDTVSATFTISPYDISGEDISVADIQNTVYSGQEQKPEPTVLFKSTTLTKDTDYSLSYSNNINAGTAKVTIKGKGNYKGEIEKSFTITQKPLTADMVGLDKNSFVYNGQAQKPTVTVTDGGTVPAENYTVEIPDVVNKGSYSVKVTGEKNYSGEITKSFEITAKNLSDVQAQLTPAEAVYDGTEKKPTVTLKDGEFTLVSGTDYTVEGNTGMTNAGNYTITVKGVGDGNYTGQKELTFKITSASISGGVIQLENAEYTYDGQEKKPTVESFKIGDKTLEKDRDYTVSYENNINAGNQAKVVITGKGNYKGEIEKSFTITPKPLTADMVSLDKNTFVYNGQAQKPTVTVKDGDKTLTEGTDYIVEGNTGWTEPGSYTITVKAVETGNYIGGKDVTFTITESSGGGDDPSGGGDNPSGGGDDPSGGGDDPSGGGDDPSGGGQDPGSNDGGEQGETPEPGSDPAQKGSDGTALGEGASAAAAEKAITEMKSDADPAGSKFGLLQFKTGSQGKTSIKLSWKRVKNADNYVLYGNACGKKNKMQKITSLKKNSFDVKKINNKNLKKGTYYKFILVALDKNNNVVSSSKIIHVSTKGGKVGNHKNVVVKAKVDAKGKSLKKAKAITRTVLKKGKKVTLKATATPASKKFKVEKHRAVVFESADPGIATVSNKGVVKAVGKGKVKIFAYAQNGVCKTVTITVQ